MYASQLYTHCSLIFLNALKRIGKPGDKATLIDW